MTFRFIVLFGMLVSAYEGWALEPVSLDSCRAMALRNNKQLLIGETNIKKSEYQREEARAAYFPSIDFVGGYTYNQKKISVFDSDQMLPVKTFNPVTGSYEFSVAKNPITGEPIKSADGQYVPQEVALIPKEAMTYNIHNVFFGAITLTQPVYMGGKIKALNRLTDYATQFAEEKYIDATQTIIYDVDVAYWQVVSLDAKVRLAESYVTLLDTLSRNVKAMWREGVATRSDTLMVRVKLNQAQVDLAKVKDMLSLSRMALAQLCGLPIDCRLQLADEGCENLLSSISTIDIPENLESVYNSRSDMRQLKLGYQMSRQQSAIEFASMLPNVSVIGAYTLSNPNIYNGFKHTFGGNFSVGLMVTVPLWHSGGNYYKYKVAQTNEAIMQLNIADAEDKIALQVRQASYKAQEAVETFKMTVENLASAKENLRQAQIGFREGVMTIDNVMEAQTAWLKANSEYVDAQIEVQLCNTYLKKVLGVLTPNS